MKKWLTRPAALSFALIVLVGSIAVAAATGSPYDILKNAVLKTVYADNVTLDANMTMLVDGKVVASDSVHRKFANGTTIYYDENDESYFSYNSTELTVTAPRHDDWYYAVFYNVDSDAHYVANKTLFGLSKTENGSQMRLVELVADMLIGDLKNNIIMSENDGIRSLSMVLTDAQIPELYNAGISVALANQGNNHGYNFEMISDDGEVKKFRQTQIRDGIKYVTEYEEVYELDADGNVISSETRNFVDISSTPSTEADYGDIIEHPVKAANIDYVSAKATVDKDGNLTSVDGVAKIAITTIFDKTYEFEINVNGTLSDYGTTTVELPLKNSEALTIDAAKAAYENSENEVDRGNNSYYHISFKAPNGVVDAESIKTLAEYSSMRSVNDKPSTVVYSD